MKIYKYICTFAIIAIFSSMMSACTGSLEIDEWAYVYSMGVDKGVSDNLRMTVQISTLKSSSGGSGSQSSSESNNFTVYTIDCPTFYSGVNMINTSLSRRLNYSQAKYFICSEKLAEQDIGNLMSAFIRDRQIRRTMHMIVVRGQASEFIKAFNPVVGTSISKTQENMMSMQEVTGFIFDTDLGHFIDDTKSTKTQPVAVLAAVNDFSAFTQTGSFTGTFKSSGGYYAGELPREGGNKTEYLGTCLFDGGKFIGELNGDETRCLLMMQGIFKVATYAITEPLKNVPVTITVMQEKRPEIKVTFDSQKAYINVRVFLEGDLAALRSDIDYESPELKPLLEKQMEKVIKGQLDETIKKCQALNCDAFGFGEAACRQFLTIQAWDSYNWLSRFKNNVITTEVEFVLRRTGTMIKTNPVISGGGNE